MADTITLLDGLLFTKPTTADVYTMDGDAPASAVKQILYDIPDCINISEARVIFNGAWDPDGGRYHVRVLATKCTAVAGTPTKTQNTTALEWTTVTPSRCGQDSGFRYRPDRSLLLRPAYIRLPIIGDGQHNRA